MFKIVNWAFTKLISLCDMDFRTQNKTPGNAHLYVSHLLTQRTPFNS